MVTCPVYVHTLSPKAAFSPFESLNGVCTIHGCLLQTLHYAYPHLCAKLPLDPITYLLRLSQRNFYSQILTHLQGQRVTLTSEDQNLLHQRGLRLDEQGLMRCHPPLS